AEGKKLLAAKTLPGTAKEWSLRSEAFRTTLIEKSLGGFPKAGPLDITSLPTKHDGKIIHFDSEPGIRLATVVEPELITSTLVIVLNCEGGAKASLSDIAKQARAAGWTVAGLEL